MNIMSNIKLGRIERIENTEIQLNEATHYNRILVINKSGKMEILLFSDYDLKRGADRACKNKEDLGKVSWFRVWLKTYFCI